MKIKYILIFILIVVIRSGYSQSYIPLVQGGNQWNVYYCPTEYELKCDKEIDLTYPYNDSIGTLIYTIPADSPATIINHHLYKKLYVSTTLNGIQQPAGYLGEDTIKQEVFYFNNYLDSFLIFDFNVVKNQLVKSGYFTYCVDTVDLVQIDGKMRKRIKFQGSDISIGMDWIEGIGSLNGLLIGFHKIPMCGGVYDYNFLLCFYNNNTLVYQSDTFSYMNCFQPVDYVISQLQSEGSGIFSVSPNPAHEYISVTFPELSVMYQSKITISDVSGEIRIQQYVSSFKTDIDIQNLMPGMYFIKISESKFGSSNKTNKRIIKKMQFWVF